MAEHAGEVVERETARVEAFSDGVFAIAITLLVLEFKVPHLAEGASSADLFAALAQLWPSLIAFLGSFGAILIMWINHHGLFRLIHKTDGPFLFANGFMLLMVTFVPRSRRRSWRSTWDTRGSARPLRSTWERSW